jgi:hypothetical protein
MLLPWLDPQRRRSIACAAVVLSLAGWVLAHRAPRSEPSFAVTVVESRATVRFEGRGVRGRLSVVPSRIAAGRERPVSLELRLQAAEGTGLSDVELALRLPPRARILDVFGVHGADPSRLRVGSLAGGEERKAVVDVELAPGASGDTIDIDATVSFRDGEVGRDEITLAPVRIDVVGADGERQKLR